MDKCNILVFHQDTLLGEALTHALQLKTELSTIQLKQQADSREILAATQQFQPSVFILNFSSISLRTIESIRQKSSRLDNTRTLIISVPANDLDVLRVIEAGADGYETEKASLADLISNVQALSVGKTLCSPRIASLLFQELADRAGQRRRNTQEKLAANLTRREIEVIALVEEDLSNKEIASELRLSIQTVKNHVHNILDKLQLQRRTEAACYARECGLLPGGVNKIKKNSTSTAD